MNPFFAFVKNNGRSLARLLPGGILMVSGYLKLVGSPEEFAAALEAYRIFPVSGLLVLARVVPWLEFLTGLALLTGYGVRGAAGLAAGLYTAFMFFIAQALIRGLPLESCGCFGRLGPVLAPWQTLVMDGVLLSLALWVARDDKKAWTLDRWIDR